MKIKESKSYQAFTVFNTVFMIFLMVIMLYPMLYVLFASLSEADLLMANKGFLLHPAGFSFSAYKATFQNPMLLSGYLNTIIIVVAGVTVNLIMTAIGAYFLSRRGVMLQKYVMMMIIFTMFFGGGLIPTYLNIKRLGLDNSLLALIIPGAISTYNLVIMRTSFQGIPESLEESAKLDGAGHLTILFRIVLPLSKAVFAVIALYYAVGHWNSWFNAMIYLHDRDKYPLQLVLREILISNDTNSMMSGVAVGDQQTIAETIKYAIIVVATAPILCIYPFVQKYFVKGVMVGAVKG